MSDGWDVAVLDNSHREAFGARYFHCDVRDSAGVMQAFRMFKPDAVSHHAAQVSVPESFHDPLTDAQVNLCGGINVLQAASAVGAKRFVFASSGGAIYGEWVSPVPADELAPARPCSPYGASKLAFEHILGRQSGPGWIKPKATVLRYSNVYGPGQRKGVVASFLECARLGRPLRVFGDTVRDYVHVEDVVRANMMALNDLVPYRVMNVCSGRGTHTLSLAYALAHHSTVVQEPARPGDVERSVMNPARFVEVCGEPIWLLDGLRDL